MGKCFLIARANLRRGKGQTAAIVALILMGAAMLNLWLMLSMDYKRNFDRCHQELNAGHVTLVLNGRSEELSGFIDDILKTDEQVTDYSIEDALCMVGSFAYNQGEVNTELLILEKEAALNRSVERMEILEEGDAASGVYLPMLYGTDGNLAPGRQVMVTIGGHEMRYDICGFLNSAMAGSHNCVMSAILLTVDCYRELEESGYAPASTLVSVRIRDKDESEAFEAELKNRVSSRYPDIRTVSNSYILVTTSRYISQMICSGIVSAMAFFVTLIALVVIASNVTHYIQENMENLGALKAVGYTGGQIVGALLLQFVGVALLTALAGTGISYMLFPGVNRMMIAQTGIPYKVHFLPGPFVLTLCAVGGTVALAVWLSSRRIYRIEPITALRQGIRTHSFKRNPVPLDTARAPLHLALAMKTTLSGMKQNITVCVTMLAICLVVVFAGLMVENVIVDMEPFIQLIVGETADSCINVNVGSEEEFRRLMEENACVEKAYMYNSVNVTCGEGEGVILLATVSEDFSEVNNQNVCFEGRFPRYENEVAVGAKFAREQGLKIGDEVRMTASGEAVYLICGFTQISNNLGKDCLLTREGYERIGTLENVSYYINVAEGTDIEAFHRETAEKIGSGANAYINVNSVVEGSASVYVSLMAIIVAAVLLLGAAITVFVLYLLVRTLLDARKRDYGIMKALGYTTGQLVLQTAAGFMPTVILSVAAGLCLCSWIINPLTAVFLSGIGIVKCTFTVPAGLIAASGVGLAAFTFGTACLLSLRIRKIVPVNLLAGE